LHGTDDVIVFMAVAVRRHANNFFYIELYSPKMVAIRKQNKNLTNLTKMLRNSPQFTI